MVNEAVKNVASKKDLAKADEFFSLFAEEFPEAHQATASILLRTYADGLRDMGALNSLQHTPKQ